jgi:hypothetical protein
MPYQLGPGNFIAPNRKKEKIFDKFTYNTGFYRTSTDSRLYPLVLDGGPVTGYTDVFSGGSVTAGAGPIKQVTITSLCKER